MTKQAGIRFAVVSGMLALAVGAPVASIVANAPPARAAALGDAEGRPVAVRADGLPVEPVVLPEETIVADAQVPALSRASAPRRPRGWTRCYRHVLEQGGSPDAPTVRVCE